MKIYKLRIQESLIVKTFLFVALFFVGFVSNASAAPGVKILWSDQLESVKKATSTYPYDSFDFVKFVENDDVGNLYVGGITNGDLGEQIYPDSQTAFVRKYDANGNILWTRQFGTSFSTGLNGLAIDATSLYVTGITYFPDLSGVGFFISKYTLDGELVWTRQDLLPDGVSSFEPLGGIAVNTSGVFITGVYPGSYEENYTNHVNTWKYSKDGEILWQKEFVGSENLSYSPLKSSATENGYYVAGVFYIGDTPPDSPVFVLKYDNAGNLAWVRDFGIPGTAQYVTSMSSYDSHVYISGNIGGQGVYTDTDFVKAINENGDTVWSSEFPFSGGVVGSNSQGVYVVTEDVSDGGFLTRRYKLSGDFEWSSEFMNPTSVSLSDSSVHEMGIYIGGWTYGLDFLHSSDIKDGADGIALRLSVDTDGDSIYNEVDPLVSEYSNEFVNGPTNGIILDRGDQILSITPSIDGLPGVNISADPEGGGNSATISTCNNQSTVSLAPGDSTYVLCEETNSAPILNSIGNQQTDEGQNLTFTVTASDPDTSDTLIYSASNLPEGATFDSQTGEFSWTPSYGQAGNYPDVEFSVMDNGSPMQLDTELITLTVNHVNRAPVFDLTGSQEVLENQSLVFTVSATDPDGDSFILTGEGIPTGAVFDSSTGVFSWIPNFNQEGTYVVNFVATDNGIPNASSTLEVVITVGNVLTPTEQADNLIDVVISYNFPTAVENSYLANLRKVPKFIEDGKITAAINQLNAFIQKVTDDASQGKITEEVKVELIGFANTLINSLSN